jgi:hypothetical protein
MQVCIQSSLNDTVCQSRGLFLAAHSSPGTVRQPGAVSAYLLSGGALQSAANAHIKVLRTAQVCNGKCAHVYAAETKEELVMRVNSRTAPGEAFPLHWSIAAQLMCDIVTVIILAIYLHMWVCHFL